MAEESSKVSYIVLDGVTYDLNDVRRAIDCFSSSQGALEQCQRLFDEAIPKFNLGASALDANAIQLLNTVPIAVSIALAKTRRPFVRPTKG